MINGAIAVDDAILEGDYDETNVNELFANIINPMVKLDYRVVMENEKARAALRTAKQAAQVAKQAVEEAAKQDMKAMKKAMKKLRHRQAWRQGSK
jgi:hypothetical protein